MRSDGFAAPPIVIDLLRFDHFNLCSDHCFPLHNISGRSQIAEQL